jgi:hypothetical protein
MKISRSENDLKIDILKISEAISESLGYGQKGFLAKP